MTNKQEIIPGDDSLSTLCTEEDMLCSRNVPCNILRQAQAELNIVGVVLLRAGLGSLTWLVNSYRLNQSSPHTLKEISPS